MSQIKREAVSVVAVHKVNEGTDLLGDHASGVSELLVDDGSAFNEGGGTLSIDGDTLTYLSWADVDDDTSTITLAAPTSSAYDDEARVAVLPLSPVMTADVVPAGGGPSLEASVWHSLDGFLREGVREPADQESGLIHYTGNYDHVQLVDVRGKLLALEPDLISGADDDDSTTPPFPDFPTAEIDLTSPDAWLVDMRDGSDFEFHATEPAPGTYCNQWSFSGAPGDYTLENGYTPGTGSFSESWPIWYLPLTGPTSAGLGVGLQVAGESLNNIFSEVNASLGKRSGAPTDYGPDALASRTIVRRFTATGSFGPDHQDSGPWDGRGYLPYDLVYDPDQPVLVNIYDPGAIFVFFHGINDPHFRNAQIVIEDA